MDPKLDTTKHAICPVCHKGVLAESNTLLLCTQPGCPAVYRTHSRNCYGTKETVCERIDTL